MSQGTVLYSKYTITLAYLCLRITPNAHSNNDISVDEMHMKRKFINIVQNIGSDRCPSFSAGISHLTPWQTYSI